MNDVVIRAKNLSKIYRLYSKPSYRFRDMFGMLGRTPNAYTEHAALDGISLEIGRGEKVAVIGRNGAGKSTFLKLVTGVIEPTSGTLDVHARVHALLQIGTGFHPDFTGRENVYAYLAQLGISGVEADRRCAETIEFAEIEEYIDQPVKVYSTGMAVRLMFSVSTSIAPDLLVLDEILGVGDAYFSHKSYGRIRQLCDQEGTTLLLVTHDIYSAIGLCDRVVWIDRGQVLMDDEGPVVVKAYEDSIRQQEESRLRTRKRERLARASQEKASARASHVLVEIHSRGNRPQPCPVYFSGIELLDGDRLLASLPLESEAFDVPGTSHLQRDATCWGEPAAWEGRQTRPFLNYGSSFHKIAGAFALPSGDPAVASGSLSLRVNYWMNQACDLDVQIFSNGRGTPVGTLKPETEAWTTQTFELAGAGDSRLMSFNSDGVQGTGAIVVDDVRMVDSEGVETSIVRHGARVRFFFDYHINDLSIREHAQFVVIFHRDGVQIASRIITRDLLFDGNARPKGRVELDIPKLVLGTGSYAVSVFVGRQGYFDEQQTVFYSLNPGVYYSLNRVLDMTVVGGGLIASGAMFVDDGRWTQETV